MTNDQHNWDSMSDKEYFNFNAKEKAEWEMSKESMSEEERGI
jgi:hypothetical protein